jgi:hypothetical protein
LLRLARGGKGRSYWHCAGSDLQVKGGRFLRILRVSPLQAGFHWHFAGSDLQVKGGRSLGALRVSPPQVGLYEPVPRAEQAKQHGRSILVSVHPLELAEVSALTQELSVDVYAIRQCEPS